MNFQESPEFTDVSRKYQPHQHTVNKKPRLTTKYSFWNYIRMEWDYSNIIFGALFEF